MKLRNGNGPERGWEDFWRDEYDDHERAGDSELSNHGERDSYGN